MSNLQVVDVTEVLYQELSELSALDTGSTATNWRLESLAKSFTSGSQMIKITVNDCLSGYCLYRDVDSEAEILNFVIAEPRRRQGLGKILLTRLIDNLQRITPGKIWLEVRKNNVPAQKLYESLGFKQVGVRSNYYRTSHGSDSSCREDALVFCKEI